jgi:hypothetical protein
MRSRCTRAKARSFTVSEHDPELVAARAAWRDEELRATYRASTARWPSARSPGSSRKGTDGFRYRGVERNEAWLNRRVAALNLRRLVVLGLTRSGGAWVLADT